MCNTEADGEREAPNNIELYHSMPSLIQVGAGFVEQQERGIRPDSQGQFDALFHPTRKLG